MFWKKKRPVAKTISEVKRFPDGICVSTEKGSYYIKRGGRYKFISDRARDSWGLPTILATFSSVESIPLLSSIGFRDGTLIKDFGTGKTYLIGKGVKLHITSPDTLGEYGMDHMPVLDVSSEEAASHSDGGVFK